MNAPRQALGALFRSLLDFLDQKTLRDEVRKRVSESTQKLLDKPPSPLSWLPSAPIDEVETALGQLAGRAALEDFGAFSARALGGGMIKPVFAAAFLLFGKSPAAAFANLDRFFTLATRGVAFQWATPGDREGVVEVRFDGPGTPTAAFHVLRGSLRFIYEISGSQGEVDPPEVVEQSEAGATVRYRVRW